MRIVTALKGIVKRREVEPWVLQHLLKTHFTMTYMLVMAGIFCLLVMAFVFWSPERKMAIMISVAVLFVIMWRRSQLVSEFHNSDKSGESLKRIRDYCELYALISGIWWSVNLSWLLVTIVEQNAFLMGVLLTGMVSSGALMYRTLDRSAYLFVGTLTLGSILSLISIGELVSYAAAVLISSHALLLFANIRGTVVNIEKRLYRENDLASSADTINMLLTDFADQGSDWLIELDSSLKIVSPSMRFAEAAKQPQESLDGLPFLSLIQEGKDKDSLRDHLNNKRIFRNQNVAVTIGGEHQFWSVSVRPCDIGGKSGFRGFVSDITARREAEERVTYMAHYDSLTDLPNRFQFHNRLTQMLREGQQLTLMFLDLDEFKQVNDTMGHAAGDELLKQVAERLNDCIEDKGFSARLGGDEFAVVLPFVEVEHVQNICTDLVQSFAIPFPLDGQDATIGTSVGIAMAPEHGNDTNSLLSNADLALYEAKSSGRNRHVLFKEGMDVAAQERRELESDLKQALARDELRLHYQPIVDVHTAVPLGYEALIRWEHPVRGGIMPDSFIPIAEECGLIVQIGEWVIRRALEDIAEMSTDRYVSINLSPVQMRNPSLISTLVFALAKTGVDPNRVCLEITESVLMQDSDANIATLHKIHELGIEIALDDFGTGFSSLNYLRSFPFDKIKIDKCFIGDVDSRDDCQAIVRSVLSLASSMGMRTTAEGVERQSQVDWLRKEGCDQLQGWLYSKAVPPEDLTDLRRPSLSHAQKLAELEEHRQSKLKAIAGVTEAKPSKRAASTNG